MNAFDASPASNCWYVSTVHCAVTTASARTANNSSEAAKSDLFTNSPCSLGADAHEHRARAVDDVLGRRDRARDRLVPRRLLRVALRVKPVGGRRPQSPPPLS